MKQDIAETGNLEQLLSRVGAGLDEYLKFEHPDALVDRDRWRAQLGRSLPEQGVGIDALTRELVEYLIPFGPSISKPGFTGYIVTGGTTAATLASAAACIASPVRYMPTAFNLVEELSLDWLAEEPE